MEQNMQSVIEQKLTVYNKYIYVETVLQLNFAWELKGIFMQAKGDYLNWVHSDQIVLEIVRRGGWAALMVAKSNARGPSGSGPLGSDGSRDGQAERLDYHEVVARDTQI